jgi:hypothetical protein
VAEELQIELERSVKACKSFNPRSRKFFEHHWLKSFEPDSNKSIEEIRESCIEHVKEKAKTEKELQEKHASKKRDESLIGFAFYVLRELAEVIKEHSESKK